MVGRISAGGSSQLKNSQVRRSAVATTGAIGALIAAAVMATSSAAPARADFDALIDPILQPILASFSEGIATFDPAAATDFTSWGDSLLTGLNTFDLAVPSGAESAATAASSTSEALTVPSAADIAISLAQGTEPTVGATVDGAGTTLLVDTGSSGIVIPYTDLGSSTGQAFENLLNLGLPTSGGFSGYAGGVDYFYLTYDTTVDYQTTTGTLATENIPVDVEVFSWPTTVSTSTEFDELFTNTAFQNFLTGNDVTGIMGIGNESAGPGISPLEAAGYNGVTVNLPESLLQVGYNGGTPLDTVSSDPVAQLSESVNGGTPVLLSNDVDSGGVYGTIPSTLVGGSSTVPAGTEISVYDGNTLLYSYTTGTNSFGLATSPTVQNEIDNAYGNNWIDSGVIPFQQEPIYLDYSSDTITFDHPLS